MKLTDPPEKAFGSETATPRDPATGRFLDGVGGSSRRGRKVGSRVKLGEKFFTALQADFEEHGIEAIARMRFLRPDVYVSVIAKLMPQKIEISTPTDGMTDERLAELLDFAERMAGLKTEQAKVIDAVAPKALAFAPQPPTSAEQRAETVRRDMLDQSDAANAAVPKLPSQALPHPVGKPFTRPEHEAARINRAKLHDDINPEDLF